MKNKKTTTTPTSVTRGEMTEIADGIVRKAVREQARDLEKHLADIHKRLVQLERGRVR